MILSPTDVFAHLIMVGFGVSSISNRDLHIKFTGDYIAGRAGAAICVDYNPCRNGGICKDADGSFSCDCPEKCGGPLCQNCKATPGK